MDGARIWVRPWVLAHNPVKIGGPPPAKQQLAA